jgi:hypothetical protein
MKLRIAVFPILLFGLLAIAFSAGRSTCACGDPPPPPEPPKVSPAV